MDHRDDKDAARAAVRGFLTTRRARVTPTDAGLPPQSMRRRVKGLRREEVALLAGVSPEYYVRLERGQATGPSVGVVDAVADVLRPGRARRLLYFAAVLALKRAHSHWR